MFIMAAFTKRIFLQTFRGVHQSAETPTNAAPFEDDSALHSLRFTCACQFPNIYAFVKPVHGRSIAVYSYISKSATYPITVKLLVKNTVGRLACNHCISIILSSAYMKGKDKHSKFIIHIASYTECGVQSMESCLSTLAKAEALNVF